MGPFLATRVPSGAAYWCLGAAAIASAISLATLPAPAPARIATPIWQHHGCAARPTVDSRPVVFVGPMLDGGTHRAVLQETTRSTLATHRPGWRVEVTDQPATDVPGFYLEGSVEDLDTNQHHQRSTISCKVTFWLASHGGKRFAVTTGSASVLTSADRRDVALSREACVQAVVEDLVERKLIEAIEHPSLDDTTITDW